MNRWHWLLAWWLLPVLLRAAPAPVTSLPLGDDLAARVRADGALEVVAAGRSGASAAGPLFRMTPAFPGVAAQDTVPAPAVLLGAAGMPGGARGVLHPADDDGDGRVDEDPLDGRDNDGDGRVDEDFAAISDAMTVIVPAAGPRLELYHWSHPHLSAAVFLAAPAPRTGGHRSTGGAARGRPARWLLPGDLPWQELALSAPARSWLPCREEKGERAPACDVVRVEAEGESVWVGIIVFSGRWRPGSSPAKAVELSGAPGLAAALVAARSPVRLVGTLLEAWSVWKGVPVRPGAPATPWIVTPPPCAEVAHPVPAAGWRSRDDGWDLVLTPGPDCHWLPDPGKIRLEDSARPEVPVRVTCSPNGAPDRRLIGAGDTGGAVADPAAALRYLSWQALLGRGTGIAFHFTGPPPANGGMTLTVGWPFGGDDRISARPLASAAGLTGAGERPPVLSPDLLEGYPNPFRDQLFLAFRVPETVGEGFVWEEDNPPALAPEAPIPYSSPVPRVTLKIYTISGREIATLYDGSAAPGTYRAEWNGCDPSGRPVAMGTYFCKLQVDKWSVTKRVSVIR